MSDDEAEAAVKEVRTGQRIAKVMGRAGVCSRRDAENWIAAGRVSVNGAVLKSPAFNVSETDDVRVDGKPLAKPERTRLFLFHKPRGLVTTARDPEGRPTVFSALPPGLPRLVAVGRLDINTEGLILLTNDGGLARVLELPSTGWLRRYRVRAHGRIDQAALDRIADGVTVGGVDYQGVEARLDREQGANSWLTLGLREGKNREIKVILEHLGLAVNRLIRVSFGPFELGDLEQGEVAEVRTRVLRDQLGVKLAREANANFDAPIVAGGEAAPEPRRGERPQSDPGREKRVTQGRSGRGASGGERPAERDGAPRRAPPKPSTPERRRKHVSALRAEIAAGAASAKGPRTRVERGLTQDRKGRTVAVERRSRAHDAESGRPGRHPLEHGRRPTPFDSKARRDGAGRGRFRAPQRGETAGGGASRPGGEPDGGRGRKGRRGKSELSGPRNKSKLSGPRGNGTRPFKPRGGSTRTPSAGRRDERNGSRPGDDRTTKTKPSRPGRGKGPPGRGPRRPPRKR